MDEIKYKECLNSSFLFKYELTSRSKVNCIITATKQCFADLAGSGIWRKEQQFFLTKSDYTLRTQLF